MDMIQNTSQSSKTHPAEPVNFTEQKKLIGRGTFGKVYQIPDGTVVKQCELFISNEEELEDMYDDYDGSSRQSTIIIDNVLREACFYTYLYDARHTSDTNSLNVTTKMFLGSPSSIPDVEVESQDQCCLMRMKHLGKPLESIDYQCKPQLSMIFSQILNALIFLHDRDWSHGDLKPSNVLVDESLKTSVIDYGSTIFGSRYKLAFPRCTIYYVAPEELSMSKMGPQSDMWSFGCLLFEFVTKTPFVMAMMKFENLSSVQIKAFLDAIKPNSGSSQTKDGREFLSQFYQTLTYGAIYRMLQKTVKDREVCSVIAHCMFIDSNARATSRKILDREPLFYAYRGTGPPLPLDIPEIKNVFEQLSKQGDLAQTTMLIEAHNYNKFPHAGITDQLRQHYMQQVIKVLETQWTGLDVDLFMHSIMLMDRLFFRKPELLAATTSRYIHSFTVFISVALTAMMSKGFTLTVESLKDKLRADIATSSLKDLLFYTFNKLEFRFLNFSPDLLLRMYRLQTEGSGDWMEEPYTCEDFCTFCRLAQNVPWVHSNVLLVTAHFLNEISATTNLAVTAKRDERQTSEVDKVIF